MTVEKFLTGLLWVGCLACFMALSWEQMDQYLSHDTGVSLKDVPVKNTERELPTLVFCPRKPFLAYMTPNQSREEVEAALNPSFNVTYKGTILDDYNYAPQEGLYEKRYLLSRYHGRCEVFKIRHASRMRQYIAFHWTLNEEMLFFAFQPGNLDVYYNGSEMTNTFSSYFYF